MEIMIVKNESSPFLALLDVFVTYESYMGMYRSMANRSDRKYLPKMCRSLPRREV